MAKVLSLKEFLETKFEQGKPIVEGLISKQELILAIAPSKSCKSFFAMNMALSVAEGIPLFNRLSTVSGRVLYWQTEISERALQERFNNLLTGDTANQELYANLMISSDRLKIDLDEGLSHLKETILDNNIEFLILDPFYTLHGKDENSASDMSTVLGNLKSLLREINIGCLLIHHEGKYFEGKSTNVNHRGRGSSAIGDVPDGHLYLKRDTGNHQIFDLDGNFRNYKPLSLRLDLTPNMKFTDSKCVFSSKRTPEELILEIVTLESLFKKDLLKKASGDSSFSNSTLEKAIMRLTDAGSVTSTKIGKEAFYSISDRSHQNTSLREKNDEGVIAPSLDDKLEA